MKSWNPVLTVLLAACLFIAAGAPSVSLSSPLERRAHKLTQEGKYLQAQKIYQKILKDKRLTPDKAQTIRKDYEDLNFKILFSRFSDSDSLMHSVEPGQSLYKIAKKYNTTIGLIKKANGLQSDKIYPGMKLKVVNGVFSILVNRSENVLTLSLNGRPVRHYTVATGANNGTPAGEFKIATKLENPTWYKAGAVAPPGSPENALGTRWLGFDYHGYGIHGTIEPNSIGRHVTAGCVRMLNEEVEELYTLVPVGAKVTVTD